MKKLALALLLSGCAGGQLPPPEYIAEIIEALKKPTKTPTVAPTATLPATPTNPPVATATPSPAVTPAPTAFPTHSGSVCSGPQRAPDGPGGFLWKNGDQTKKIAVILPGEFAKADKVVVVRLNGQTENLYWAGYGNPDENGERQHWRGSQPTGKYKGQVEAFTGSEVCKWTFKNAPRVD